MSKELPRNKGESSILWSDDECRIRIECHGDAWTIHSEAAFGVDDYGDPIWEFGGVPLSAWRSWWWTGLGLFEFGGVASQMLMMITKGSTAMPTRKKPVQVARARGWWVSLTDEDGADEPLIGIDMKRPLCGEELVAFLDKFTKWSDARKGEWGDA